MHANAAGYGATSGAHLKSHKLIVPTVIYYGAMAPPYVLILRSPDYGGIQLVSAFAATHAVVVYMMMRSLESGQIRKCVRGRDERCTR